MTTNPSVDWAAVSDSGTPTDTDAAAPAPAQYGGFASAPLPSAITLPELPEVIGRLPIKPGTRIAIIQLPEPIKGVSCAAVFANVTILSDCDAPAKPGCGRPAVKYARPLNDREIEVEFWDGDGTVAGPGWKTSAYPGGQLETRPVPLGVPVVEVKIVSGRAITCGCDPDKWAVDSPYGA